MSREDRENELRRQLERRVSNTDLLDLSALSDVELDGLISMAGRKAIRQEERGERTPRRTKRR